MFRRILVWVLVLAPFSSLFAQKSIRTLYDDSTLHQGGPFTVMPFNRWLSSAGKVVTFGDPRQENHALDFAVLPDSQHIVIEDRFGIAVLDLATQQIVHRWTFVGDSMSTVRGLMSTYCGIKCFVYEGRTYIAWSAGSSHSSALMIAEYNKTGIGKVSSMFLDAVAPAAAALPNDIAIRMEAGVPYLYVVLNGNNQLIKVRFPDRQIVWTANTGVAPYGLKLVGGKAYVTNWAGPLVTDTTLEHAGTPWGSAYTNPVTGGTAKGSLSVIDVQSGAVVTELSLGLHPNAIVSSPDSAFLYISNGNSDNVSVVDVRREAVVDSIGVGLFSG
ncbi:MAG TPA: phosphoesterase, partial [Puia sp.]|nr:phosphoesterase [Puia sp.]